MQGLILIRSILSYEVLRMVHQALVPRFKELSVDIDSVHRAWEACW